MSSPNVGGERRTYTLFCYVLFPSYQCYIYIIHIHMYLYHYNYCIVMTEKDRTVISDDRSINLLLFYLFRHCHMRGWFPLYCCNHFRIQPPSWMMCAMVKTWYIDVYRVWSSHNHLGFPRSWEYESLCFMLLVDHPLNWVNHHPHVEAEKP